MNAIEISGLRKSYGDFVLDDISFCVPEGAYSVSSERTAPARALR